MPNEIAKAERLAIRIAVTKSVAAGMQQLIALMRESDPKNKVWNQLDKIDYADDARRICKGFERHLLSVKPGAKTKQLQFLLDCLNMPDGKGIEVWAAPSREGESILVGGIPSKALSKLFANVEANYAQITLGIGYLGLAVKEALKAISPKTVLGGAKKLSTVIGFHDGDLIELGTVTAEGLQLVNPPKAQQKAKPAKNSVSGAEWPTTNSTQIDWLVAAGHMALAIADVTERVREVVLLIEMLDDRQHGREAAPLAEAIESVANGRLDRMRKIDVWLAVARVRGAQEDKRSALELLLKAEAAGEQIRDPFWRRTNLGDVHRVAAKLGLAGKLRTKSTEEHRSSSGVDQDEADIAKLTDCQIAEIEAGSPLVASGNHHCAFALMERAAGRLLAVGDKAGFNRAVARIERLVGSWKLSAGGWVAAAVYTGLGRLLAKAARMPDAMKAFRFAEEEIALEQTASTRAAQWSELSTVYSQLKLWHDAERVAKMIGSSKRRREVMAANYLRAGDEAKLAALLNKVQKPEEAADLARQLSFNAAGDE